MSENSTFPGEKIASIEEYEAGHNTFDDGDMVRASTIGEIDMNKTTRVASVNHPKLLSIPKAGDGLKIPNTSYKNELKLEWAHVESGTTKILIQNTGDSDLEITAVTKQTPNPFGFTFDVMVLITGIIIIGMSMGFTKRKPKGF